MAPKPAAKHSPPRRSKRPHLSRLQSVRCTRSTTSTPILWATGTVTVRPTSTSSTTTVIRASETRTQSRPAVTPSSSPQLVRARRTRSRLCSLTQIMIGTATVQATSMSSMETATRVCSTATPPRPKSVRPTLPLADRARTSPPKQSWPSRTGTGMATESPTPMSSLATLSHVSSKPNLRRLRMTESLLVLARATRPQMCWQILTATGMATRPPTSTSSTTTLTLAVTTKIQRWHLRLLKKRHSANSMSP